MFMWKTLFLKLNCAYIYRGAKYNQIKMNKEIHDEKEKEMVKILLTTIVLPKRTLDLMNFNISRTFALKTRVIISGLSSCL